MVRTKTSRPQSSPANRLDAALQRLSMSQPSIILWPFVAGGRRRRSGEPRLRRSPLLKLRHERTATMGVNCGSYLTLAMGRDFRTLAHIMATGVSLRIAGFVAALPLKDGLRVLEIGCGPGVAAREVARRIGNGFILAIDRSEKAIRLARAGSASEIASGHLNFRHAAIEDFELSASDDLFDMAFAMRVGVLDGRHPGAGRQALMRIKSALKPNGRLFIDGGKSVREINLRSG